MKWKIFPVDPTDDHPASYDDELLERCARAVADARLREWGDYAGLDIRPVEYEYARAVLEVLFHG